MSEKDFTIMHSRNMQQVSVTQRITKVLTLFITYVFLIVMALIVLFPFYWMVLTSVKSYSAYSAERIPAFFTLSPTLQNYHDAFTAVPLGRYFLNTVIFTVATTAIMLVVITLAAFPWQAYRLYMLSGADDDSQ